ncbi:hypothetical protein IC582_010002 [Cucumis melo]
MTKLGVEVGFEKPLYRWRVFRESQKAIIHSNRRAGKPCQPWWSWTGAQTIW